MIEKVPIWYYQYYFGHRTDEAQAELEKDVRRTLCCLFRSSRPEDQIGRFMTSQSKGFLSDFPARVTKSNFLLTDQEFERYVQEFQRTGFRGGLHYYATTELNWKDEEGVPAVIEAPALMICAADDHVLPPVLTQGMEKWIPHLKRVILHDASHWVQHEQPDALISTPHTNAPSTASSFSRCAPAAATRISATAVPRTGAG